MRKDILKKLEEIGINEVEFDTFKLYNPDTYDKFTQQAKFSVDVAVKNYEGVIRTSNKRV